ncbi:hypothetical protein NUKP32_53870 [Klebsiella variicola]|nr:hypothetical protein NUKP32_53870 [Klebsiella variicola]
MTVLVLASDNKLPVQVKPEPDVTVCAVLATVKEFIEPKLVVDELALHAA